MYRDAGSLLIANDAVKTTNGLAKQWIPGIIDEWKIEKHFNGFLEIIPRKEKTYEAPIRSVPYVTGYPACLGRLE